MKKERGKRERKRRKVNELEKEKLREGLIVVIQRIRDEQTNKERTGGFGHGKIRFGLIIETRREGWNSEK